MKSPTITMVMAAAILTAGCSKQNSPSAAPAPPPAAPANVKSSSSPVAQPALTAWQQGDQAGAISNFVAANWSAGPLFAADSPLSLSETQFRALSAVERQVKGGELDAQLKSLKLLVAAVVQAGEAAATKGDTAQATKCFTALKQFGAALNSPNSTDLVKLVGQSFEKTAIAESAKLGH